MSGLWVVVLGMGIVTYLPRMLPVVFLKGVHLPRFWMAFLRYVPFAALGALIFPGILSSTGDTASAVCGGAAALLLSWARINIVLIVVGSIGAVYMWNLLM
ncbi:MAG: AzlD domain-containing protein [Syntrophomonadaceae bacterium]